MKRSLFLSLAVLGPAEIAEIAEIWLRLPFPDSLEYIFCGVFLSKEFRNIGIAPAAPAIPRFLDSLDKNISLGHHDLAASVDIQSLLRGFAVEALAIEGVPCAKIFTI